MFKFRCYYVKGECRNIFEQNVKKYGINKVYAYQTLFPFEVNMITEKIDKYHLKISNRPFSLHITEQILKIYLEIQDIEDILNNNDYLLLANLSWFKYHIEELDANEILKIKHQINL